MNLQWDNTHRRRSFLDCDVISFPIVTSHLLARLSICCAGFHTSSPLKNRAWGRRRSGPVFLQRSDAVARIPANGSAAFNKSCAPIGKNSSATALVRQGVMSNATRLGGTVSGGILAVRALAHASCHRVHAPCPRPVPPPPPPPPPLPLLSLFFRVNPRHKFRFFTPPRPSDPRPRHLFLKLSLYWDPKHIPESRAHFPLYCLR